MKRFKLVFSTLILVMAFSMPALAGEQDTPARTAPGEQDTPARTAPGEQDIPARTAPGEQDIPARTVTGQLNSHAWAGILLTLDLIF